MLAGTFAGVTKPASAAGATLGYWPEPLEIPNEYYYENQTLQPYGSCFQIDELKNWSPDNDPDARYNRGAIPLRERWMGPSVNPLASRDAKIMPPGYGQRPGQPGCLSGRRWRLCVRFQQLPVRRHLQLLGRLLRGGSHCHSLSRAD